jgi:O-antigen ligase
MPEHLKALIVILIIAAAFFAAAAAPARALLGGVGEFKRRRNLWFAITLAAFLSHNIWLFLLIAGLLLFAAAAKDNNKTGLVLFVLLAVPPLPAEIPGLGIIRYFFAIDYLRLISLVVLLPVFMQEIATHSAKRFTEETADKLLLAYLLMCVCLTFAASTFTGTLRTAFLYFIDIVLPYAIASRLPRDKDAMRAAFASYVIGAAVMACIGVFEFLKKWLLYSALDTAFGFRWELGHYLMREESLRALATTGHSIPFGYVMAVAIVLMLGLRRFFARYGAWLVGLALLVMGLISSFSRGPWFGALAGVLVFVITGRRVLPNFVRLAAAGILLVPALFVTPVGEKIVYYFTSVDDGSYSYRARLFEISVGAILQNPLFGAYEFIRSTAFQELKQGGGIIDIVNTYLAVGLSSGLTGLTLFVAFFVTAMFGVWRQMKSIDASADEAHDLGRGLLAALACTLVTIVTVSSITVIPVIYYLIAGLAVAYTRWVRVAFAAPKISRRLLAPTMSGPVQTMRYSR